ncbi:carbohydrate kinase family protein [Kitasatospora sp. NPDC001540]|uniref:carbohydrate kinase family protein n=1 Tax=Kitasatospora sp. NPDC001540 TaxID=3364014 RepID=UPI0036994BBD
MRIAVTGSIATDHLMTFPGRFTDQLLADQLSCVSLSFLVDALEVRRGGVAANIAFGLGQLGLEPVLVGSVGNDFAEYDAWLTAHGVDTCGVRICSEKQTARFMCITDLDANQIAAFYTGAMQEAAEIDLSQLARTKGQPDLVLICANDPSAMLLHTAHCRDAGVPFAADPSQQLARMSSTETRDLIRGARWLFSNEYEAALLLERTGWSRDEVLNHVGTWVTTLGERGVRIDQRGRTPLSVPAVQSVTVVDPTGVGDAFRAGFLTGVGRGLALESAAQLGCVLAAEALGGIGPQSYSVDHDRLISAAERAYGVQAAHRMGAGLLITASGNTA